MYRTNICFITLYSALSFSADQALLDSPILDSPILRSSYYGILGITPQSNECAIKKAYRSQALRTHPDKNKKDPHAEEKFKSLKEAYEHLIDNDKKSTYDQQLADQLLQSDNKLEQQIGHTLTQKQPTIFERLCSLLHLFSDCRSE